MTTVHANSPRDALSRVETLVLTAGVDLPLRAIREQVASAFDLIVQLSRLVDGTRVVTHVTEVLRMESDVVTLQDLFVSRPSEAGDSLLEPIRPTGIRPHFVDKLRTAGVTLGPELFDPMLSERRLKVANGRAAR
jgi:pilus assembly protein CpaF